MSESVHAYFGSKVLDNRQHLITVVNDAHAPFGGKQYASTGTTATGAAIGAAIGASIGIAIAVGGGS